MLELTLAQVQCDAAYWRLVEGDYSKNAENK